MPVDYRYDTALKAVVSTVRGVLEERAVLSHLLRLEEDDAVPSGFFENVEIYRDWDELAAVVTKRLREKPE